MAATMGRNVGASCGRRPQVLLFQTSDQSCVWTWEMKQYGKKFPGSVIALHASACALLSRAERHYIVAVTR